MKQLGETVENYRGAIDGEFAKNKAEVMKRLSEVEGLAEEESRKTNESLAKLRVTGASGAITFQGDVLGEGEIIAQGQQQALINSNGLNGLSIDTKSGDANFNFSLNVKDAEEAAKSDGKGEGKPMAGSGGKPANLGNETRLQLRMSNDANIDALNTCLRDE